MSRVLNRSMSLEHRHSLSQPAHMSGSMPRERAVTRCDQPSSRRFPTSQPARVPVLTDSGS